MNYADYLDRFCGAALYRQADRVRAETRTQPRETGHGTTEPHRTPTHTQR
jgi:hypothetical protein